MCKILLIEDDRSIATHLAEFLDSEGFKTLHALGQTDGLSLFDSNKVDCVLLDVSLEDGNGFEICRKIRENSRVPIIFLTASGDESCLVAGFELGADDYIAKPFRPRELVARIKNALGKNRRTENKLTLGNVTVDVSKGYAEKNGSEIFLSALEYRLFLVLASNKGKLMSRERLIEELWSESGEYVSDNTLTVYIKRLREKIEDDPADPRCIKTVRGLGYKAEG